MDGNGAILLVNGNARIKGITLIQAAEIQQCGGNLHIIIVRVMKIAAAQVLYLRSVDLECKRRVTRRREYHHDTAGSVRQDTFNELAPVDAEGKKGDNLFLCRIFNIDFVRGVKQWVINVGNLPFGLKIGLGVE